MLTDIVYSELEWGGPGTAEEIAERVGEAVPPVRWALLHLTAEGLASCVVASVSDRPGTFYAGTPLDFPLDVSSAA